MTIETVRYSIDGATFEGQLVYDETVGTPRPAVLMAPNWTGVNAASAERAQLIAGERYVVLVTDMYGASKRPRNFEEAAALANPLRADALEARRRIVAALSTLIEEGERRHLIDTKRKAAVGFCFGGGNVLELARSGADIQAVVSIHGDLASPLPAGPGDITAAVLAIHGTVDPISPKAQRDAFETEMDRVKAKWQLLMFGGLLHAFTDVGADFPGVAKHDAPATRQTYDLMHAFIADAFAGRL